MTTEKKPTGPAPAAGKKPAAPAAAKAPAPAGAPGAAGTAGAAPAKKIKGRAAAKAARKAIRQHLQNKGVKSSVRTFVRKALEALEGSDQAQAEAAVNLAVQALDQAAKKGVLHPNNAARRKSRLLRRLNLAKASAAPRPRRRTRRAAAKA